MVISWADEVRALGFETEEAMLRTLYLERGLSLRELEKLLGYNRYTIRFRLMKLGIVLRPRGGANNKGNHKLFNVPTSEILELSAAQLAMKYGVNQSTAVTEKQRRRREDHG